MTQTITFKVWNEKEQKVTKIVKVENVLNVKFFSKYYQEIDFYADSTEIFIMPELNDIEFNFDEDKKYVFITIKDSEAQ